MCRINETLKNEERKLSSYIFDNEKRDGVTTVSIKNIDGEVLHQEKFSNDDINYILYKFTQRALHDESSKKKIKKITEYLKLFCTYFVNNIGKIYGLTLFTNGIITICKKTKKK